MNNFFLIIALLMDSAGLFLFFALNDSVILVACLHAAALTCIVIHLIINQRRFKKFTPLIIALMVALPLFVPALGVIGVWMLTRWLVKSQKHFHRTRIRTLSIQGIRRPILRQFDVGGLKARLQMKGVAPSQKIAAMQAASLHAASTLNRLFRALLSDSNDEVRLFAFQLLSQQEKRIIPQISHTLKMLDGESDPERQAKLKKHIAFLYWEMDYRSLVEPNLIEFTLKKSLGYAEAALAVFPKDPSLLLLLGQLNLKFNNNAAALHYFILCLENGGLIERLTPYIAEIYYNERQFEALKASLKAASPIPTIYMGKHFLEFWSASHA